MIKLKNKLKNIKYYTLDILLFTIYFVLGSMFFPDLAILILLILFIIYRLILMYLKKDNNKLKSYIHLYSVLIEGFKRRGKDLFMQVMIYLLYGRKFFKTVKKIRKQGYSMKVLNDLVKKYDIDINKLADYIDLKSWNDLDSLSEEQYFKAYFYCSPLYLSTVDYGYGVRIVTWNEFKIYKDQLYKHELTFNDFINNEKEIYAKKCLSFEGKNLFAPDLGTTFPAAYHGELLKKYPSLPIFFMIGSQLYDMNIVANAQYINLIWDKLRNQQDITIRIEDTNPRNKSFMKAISSYLPFFRKYKVITLLVYTKQDSAIQGLLPFKPSPGMINRKMIKMEKEKYDSENGKIYRMRVLLKNKWLKYDTREWHYKVFKFRAPK